MMALDHMPTSCPVYADPHEDACRAMWCAVFDEGWRLAIHPGKSDSPIDISRARDWFGSRDFYLICQFIGFDGDDALAAYHHATTAGAVRRPMRKRV
ncbi:MAG: hypothetical protein L0G27_02905 [Paracoccus sp. (in: a-proteobacteria)]|nr:hypothetical protein [Paracoccus sp. (in: a-proteobacteria)]